jgi:CRISPR-associated protein Cas2
MSKRDGAHLSGYRLMWIFVMFDLPVGSKKQMRDATKFREFLLDQGFEMSQFSVYARFCNGKESFESHLRRIESNLPEKGEVHVLTFTANMRISCDFRASAASARAGIPSSSRCSDYVRANVPTGWGDSPF